MSLPLKSPIQIEPGLFVSAKDVVQHIEPLLTAERRKKIHQVIQGRSFDVAVVLEGIYDRGNISAVMRSAEAFGFAHFHLIETQEKFKESNRVAQGADKWVEAQKWKNTKDCVAHLKSKGHKIYTTSLHATKTISEIDWTHPCALVLGNEKSGASDEIVAASDETFIIPMSGFVQSFNISVAGALCFYEIWNSRMRKLGTSADLNEEEQEILLATYCLRTQDSGTKILAEKVLRKEIQEQPPRRN